MPTAVEKTTQIIGMKALVEASYGAGGAPADATDAIQLIDLPELALDKFLWDGAIGKANGGGAQLPDNPPVGGELELTYRVRFKGAGSAYAAGNRAKDIKVGMAISGHDVVIDTTGGAEKETHTPRNGPTGFPSGVYELFSVGEKYIGTGVVADLVIRGEEVGPIVFEFPLRGLLGMPVDAAVPALTYPETVDAPNNTGVVLSLGVGTPFAGAGARLASWRFEKHAEILGPRTDTNAAGGHAGFGHSGARDPQLIITLERTALKTITPWYDATQLNPYELLRRKDKFAWALGPIGGVDYNRLKLSGPKAQVIGVKPATVANGVAAWELTLRLLPTAMNGADDYTILLPRV